MLSFKECMDVVQSLVTTAAIVVGGVWSYVLFVRKRLRYPRANVEHLVAHSRLAEGVLFVRVTVTISNIGDVLVSLVSGELRVQQIVPAPAEVLGAVAKGDDPIRKGETEVRWPLLGERKRQWESGDFEIEPGETDEQLCFDFFLPAEVRMIQIYSFFSNKTKHRREIGWGETTVHDLTGVQWFGNREDSPENAPEG